MPDDELPYTVGSKPNTVRIFRRKGRRNIYIRCWDPSLRGGRGGYRVRSLKHNDVERAKAKAASEHAKLVGGEKGLRAGRITLARLFTLYERHRTPQKGEHEQGQDERRIELFTRFLGARKDPQKITRAEWERFVERRSSGAIDARGNPVPETAPCPACGGEDPAGCDRCEGTGEIDPRRPIGPRTVGADLVFLNAVLNWGTDWRVDDGYLLDQNVCRGFDVPKEKNPNRPVASVDRADAIREVYDEVTMAVTWGQKQDEDGKRKKRRKVPSHLPAIFEVACGTGRRLSAVLGLRYADLLLEKGPHGAVRWRADTDKEGRESVVPIGPRVRKALDRHAERMRSLKLPGIGEAPLFPSPKDPSEPLDRSRADRWLRQAEDLAGLEPQEGTLWHAYRRKWATERKHLPAPDVAEAGGWAGPETLQEAYQQADEETMLKVVLEGGELREAGDR